MLYPNVSDDNFNKLLTKKFEQFRVSKKKKSFEKICHPKNYELQIPQKFVAKYINPNTPYNGILVFHQIGSGKTCTSIQIAETWKKFRHIIVVVPASLIGNYRNELRSNCVGQTYITDTERDILKKVSPTSAEYKKIIATSDARIDKFYKIYSYNMFVKYSNSGEISLKNTLLIIDEIQNMVSEDGTYYKTLRKIISDAPETLKVVLLSATPMFDRPNEIALTMNLLRLPKALPEGDEFNKLFLEERTNANGSVTYRAANLDLFKKYIRGYVSYFRGADPISFPELKLKYVKCEMSKFQYNAYTVVNNNEQKKFAKHHKSPTDGTIEELPNNFFIGTRMVSNIVFPNGKVGEPGLASLTRKNIVNSLDNYSAKFYKIFRKINRCHGKTFVYSTFRGYGGLESFIKILETFGYKNYEKFGSGRKRFGIFSGSESIEQKSNVQEIYNRTDNIYGEKLKLLLLSPAAKEGLSLYGVKQVHILEPYWNFSRILQILGRAVRYCSHKLLPEEQRTVQAYIYIATHEGVDATHVAKCDVHGGKRIQFAAQCSSKLDTIDEHIAKLAQRKMSIISEFENALKEGAVDCAFFKSINNLGDLKCDT